MNQATCDHFMAVRWPRVSDLSCSACGLKDEGLISALGLRAPLSPADWEAIRGELTEEDWEAIAAELPGAVARARAAQFLEAARSDLAAIEGLTPAGVRWASFALAAEKTGPKLDKALKRAIARTSEALSSVAALEKATNEAWSLAESEVPFIEDPAAPTASFEAERDLLSSVGFLLLQRYRGAFFEGLASNTARDLRPIGPGRFLLSVFVAVSPRERVAPLLAAARCLERLYQIALGWKLGRDEGDGSQTAKAMIARERRAVAEEWERRCSGGAPPNEEPGTIPRPAVIALRDLAGSARPAMQRTEEDQGATDPRLPTLAPR